MRWTAVFTLLLLFGCQTPTHYDIGAIHWEITTSSPDAQLWFDRGLGLSYGFNHEEAIRCFERALEEDPRCAMANWGKAYALGPNYNNAAITDEASQAAYEASRQAIAEMVDCTPIEKDVIGALQVRYAWPAQEDRASLEAAYAEAMEKVYAAHPDSRDVAGLTAEALMQLKPWELWSHDGKAAPETARIREVLESGLRRWPDHPPLCHLYIHTMEAGPEVEKAIPAAETLETLTPGLGHLVHMPSHIYTWTGRYEDMIRVNQEAVRVDGAYVKHAGRLNFFTLYRIHNYHFVAYGGMFDGQRDVALRAARELLTEVPPELLSEMPDLLDIFMATPYHVLVRFGMWEEILAEPAPAPELLATRPVWHYARGIAFASLGRVDDAAREHEAFLMAKAAVPETRLLFQNPVAEILAVAEHVLAGEIDYRRGNHDRAFELLREAVRLDERLNYDEPWGWMEPARHALGALLTEQGRYTEAIEVYQANLARYPENGWAFHGLAECLRKSGRLDEAIEAERRFKKAWARADVEIPGSCFCRTGS